MLRGILYGVALSAAATLFGCSASTSFAPLTGASDNERAQLASFAAKADYPTDAKATDDFHAAARVSHDGRSIELENLSDEPLQSLRVWVNGAFVRQVDSVPAHGILTLRGDEFYNRNGTNMVQAKEMPLHVTAQAGERLYMVRTVFVQ